MEFAVGSVDMLTGEQMECGQDYYYESRFAVFDSYRDAIFKRAWMLMRSPYYDHIAMYVNPNDGTFTVEQANSFMYGIRAGGWATDLEYVEKNIGHMESFELYRFDNMTFDEFWNDR
jgi:flagellum-specific peptidoglycan hydrolase FlgJ